jgi:hypothetical protein
MKCNETVGKWCKNKHGASKIMDTLETYQELKLDHPAGEDRDLTELGEAKGGTVVWPKEHIVLPNYVPPRPPTPQCSNPLMRLQRIYNF